MRSAALLLLVVVLGVIGPSGQPPVRAQAAAEADLALVPADATAFIRIRFADLWNSPLAQVVRQQAGAELAKATLEMEKETGLKLTDIDTINVIVLGVTGGEREPPIVVVLSTAQPYDAKKIIGAMKGNVQVRKHAGKAYHIGDWAPAIHFASDRMIVAGDEPLLKRFLEGSAKPAGGKLAAALKLATEKHHLVAGFQVPEPFLQMAKQKSLPPGAEFLKPLLEVHSGSLVVDVTADIRVQATLNLPSDAAAKEAADGLKKGLELVKQQIAPLPLGGAGSQIAKQLENLTKEIKVEPQRSSVVVTAQTNTAGLIATLMPAVQRVREAANRMLSANNMKQMAIAMHDHHATYDHMPPQAIMSKDGKPLLSWRVAILPYMEHDALYKEFKLDEPWDSTHNKKLLEKMPKFYAHPNVKPKEPYTTHYQVFVSKAGVKPGAAFEEGRKVTLGQLAVQDGSSNTVLMVEAAEAVPWTKPQDLAFDPSKPLPKLGGLSPDGFEVCLCDGSVHSIKKQDYQESLFRALITRNGGETDDVYKLFGR